MMNNISLPPNLNSVIGSERRDFTVKAGRAQPLGGSIFLIVFGVLWMGITSLPTLAFLGPIILGRDVNFTTNGVPTVAGPNNLGPIIFPAIIIGGFALIGLAIMYGGIRLLYKKGGVFVGTPIRLVHFQNGKIRSIDWEQFSGDISISGDDQKGSITLKMRSGKMVSRDQGSDRYVPNTIYLIDIPNAFQVEQICRKRIKENDSTPVVVK